MLIKALNISFISPLAIFKRPTNDEEYLYLEKILDELIDEIRGNESHPLALVMQIIGENLELYDNEHYPTIGEKVTDIEMVKYLMEIHGLNQTEPAPIFGGQANVQNFLMEKEL